MISRPIVANITVYMSPHEQTTLCIEGNTLDTNQLRTLHSKSFRNLVIGEIFGSVWGGEEKLAFKNCKISGGKSTNELSYIFFSTFKFLQLHRIKGIQGIVLKLLRAITVNTRI